MRLAVALVETRATGSNSERPWFVSESKMLGSPSLVILRRNQQDDWRVLMTGLLGYDIVVDDLSRLLRFRWQDSSQQKPTRPRLLGPPEGVLARNGESYEWQLSASNADHLNVLVETNYSGDGWPTIVLSCLSDDPATGSSPMQIDARRTGRIWTIAAGGEVSFSDIREWQPEPRRLPEVE